MQEAPTSGEAVAQGGGDSLYTIQPVPGMGLGLIATKNIPKGARILSELPLFTPVCGLLDGEAFINHISNALKDLGEDKERAFLNLHNAYGTDDDPLRGIAQSNMLPLGHDTLDYGLFLTAARINHSCRPNAHKSWNDNIGRLTVHAVCDIEAGEEITISYLQTVQPYVERKALLEHFRFECGCKLCSAPPQQCLKSDLAMLTINEMEREMMASLPGIHYTDGLALAHDMFTELENKGAWDARFAGVYYIAFVLAVWHGDRTRAKIFAARAYAARVVFEGDDNPLAMFLAECAKEPARHPHYRPSGDDDAMEVQPLRGLSGPEFEEWLWKLNYDGFSSVYAERCSNGFGLLD
ncbi:hypothetical protein ACQKWADRAFT_276861 [Trichoderma austrokoningii]